MTVFLILFFSIIIAFQIYFDKVIAKKIPVKRKQKIFELLKDKFGEIKENDLGFFEYKVDDKKILFEYNAIRFKNSFSNNLYVYLDITDIEDDIKKLCKIHFYCSAIDNQDWVKMNVDVLFGTLNNLVKSSSKTVHELISETDYYISQKRAERDNNTVVYIKY